jgi:PAS domain S-box-containing protein
MNNTIESTTAQDEIRRRSEELAALNAVAAIVSQSLNLQFALESALKKVLELTGIESGSIYLLDDMSMELITRAHHGVSEELLRDGDRLKVGEEFTGGVALSGTPMVVEDVSNDPRLHRTVLKKEGYRSLVSIPLRSKGRALGVMTLVTREQRRFTLSDLQLLASFGDVVGVAIENAMLYAQLAASEANYRGMFENAAVGIYRSTPAGKMLEANDTLARLLGYASGYELLNVWTPELYVDAGDRRRWQEELEREDVLETEVRMRRRDGRAIWIHDVGRVVRDADGQVLYYEGTISDITERKEAEEALRRSQDRLARIYDVMTRYQGQALYDHAAETLAELLGMKYVFIDELDRDGRALYTLASYHQGVIQGGRRYELGSLACERSIAERKPLVFPQGVRDIFPADSELNSWLIESYAAAPLMDSQGNAIGVVVAMDEQPKAPDEIEPRILQMVGQRIGAEIERQRQEEAQRRLQEQLFQSQKMESVGTLAGGIAHDFNNLLTGIMGFSEMMMMKLGSDHQFADYLKRILSLGGRARDLIQQLLLFSRPTTGAKAKCNLRVFLDDAMVLLRRTIPENVEIDMRMPGECLVVEVNPSQLQQVVLNLAVNARDAMPTGGRLGIEAHSVVMSEIPAEAHGQAEPGRFVRLTISDTGAGIPPHVLSHIFEPFFTTKDVGRGSGLGLSVVYGIVKAHGGWIEVESELEHGTRFHIHLPLVEGIVEQETSPESEQIVGGDETILIVEDEPMVLEMGRNLLQMLGYHVYAAREGREAVSLYTRHREEIDLVLLDVVMPQMSGQKAFARLRAVNPQAKILLVTGYSPEDVAEDLLRQGAEGVVQKPYNMVTLARSIRQSLDNRIV